MAFDPALLVDIAFALGGLISLAFILGEVATLYMTKGATQSIVGTATVAINAITAITGVGVTANQAVSIMEITGVPTQLVTPPGTSTPATTTEKKTTT